MLRGLDVTSKSREKGFCFVELLLLGCVIFRSWSSLLVPFGSLWMPLGTLWMPSGSLLGSLVSTLTLWGATWGIWGSPWGLLGLTLDAIGFISGCRGHPKLIQTGPGWQLADIVEIYEI